MKYLDNLDQIPGKRIGRNGTFSFDCRKDLPCFNQCCHNLNLFLYPYDIIRLKNFLGVSSDRFIDLHMDVVLRKPNFFPDALLKMNEDDEKSCPFLSLHGCSVYSDRPGTCRWFPIEPGTYYDAKLQTTHDVYFFRPPDFCLGRKEDQPRTIQSWSKNQNIKPYYEMALAWAELKKLFQVDPWGKEGANGPKAKMAFMAAYNIDSFREFIFKSSFLKRYKIPHVYLKKIRMNDAELLRFGFEWIRFFVWGISSKMIIIR